MGELSTLIAQHSKLMADMKELMQVRSELESLKLQVLQAELKLMDRELKLSKLQEGASPMKKKGSQHSTRRKPRKPEGPTKNTNTDSSGLWNWGVQ
jgi:hypothetical protein